MMHSMRTTFTPDPDVEAKIKAIARSSKKSMSRVLNEILRQALADQNTVVQRPRFEVKPFDLDLNPGIDPLRLNQVVDEIEDEEIIMRMRREHDHS